jgi:hypothetical protein
MAKRKCNPTDGTVRNVRASNKRDEDLLARIKKVEKKLIKTAVPSHLR